jgi:hypothetical protein
VEQLMLLASEECDLTLEPVCAPAEVTELFEFRTPIVEILGFPVTRTVVLIVFAALIAITLLWLGLRKKAVRPGKGQVATESLKGSASSLTCLRSSCSS